MASAQLAQPASVEEAQVLVCAYPKVQACGCGSKPALSAPLPGAAMLDLSRLAGILEYEPAEYTFTALAGTPLAAVSQILAQNGQCLPFDPPLASRGATLGGTVAAGLSGPGRYQYGGVRDFLLGVRYIDGEGQLIHSGGRVVKNAAGYDLPKLMVGSLGQFGVLTELTFKVLPLPEASATAHLYFPKLEEALQAIYWLAVSPLDPNAIDLEVHAPEGDGYRLSVRLTGLESALPIRLERLRKLVYQAPLEESTSTLEVVHGAEEAAFWDSAREMDWVPSGWSLVKIPLTPRKIPALETALAGIESLRRYSSGGQLLWLATPASIPALNERLSTQNYSGLLVFGPPGLARLGARGGATFERRVKSALDPSSRFLEV